MHQLAPSTLKTKLGAWLFTSSKSSVTHMILLLGGLVTLLRIYAQQLPTMLPFEWVFVGYLLYYLFTVVIWVGTAIYLTRVGQRKWWEWVLCIPIILWGSYAITEMDRPAAALLVLPLVIRYWWGLKPALISAVLIALGTTYEYHYFAQDWGSKAFGVSLKDTITTLLLTLSQGVFSYGAYELALKNQEKQQQLEFALYTLESYRNLEIENTTLQERSRLSRELHDSLGHQLTILRLESQKAARLLQKSAADPALVSQSLNMIVERSGEAFSQLQDIVSTLRETELDGTLFQAIEQLTKNWPEQVQLNFVGKEPHLSSAARLALYRAVQECLTNAYKYANGQKVQVELQVIEHQITVNVRNRLNIPSKTPTVEWLSGGTGLAGLQQRFSELGGQVHIHRTQEAFEVCLTLPY